ncbi:MAG: ATP-binding protein [Oscillospiraceae bacterium]
MTKKIFLNELLASCMVLVLVIGLIFGILTDVFEHGLTEELSAEARQVASVAEVYGEECLDVFNMQDRRLTFVAKDGSVIYDTKADTASMENHSDREEIREAKENGEGSSVRQSDTFMTKTIYYAVRLTDGSVIRIAADQNVIAATMKALVMPAVIVFFAALLLSGILSFIVSKSILKPINGIDTENPSKAPYPELEPLTDKLSAQHETIKKQLRDAQRSKEEFRLITENMSEGFVVTDINTSVLTYNTAASRILGIEKDAGSILAEFCDVAEKAVKGAPAEAELQIGERIYRLIANPVFDEEKIIGAVIVILDVTERCERERLRREFTSNVSHELKTPLTSISGFAELMMSGGTPDETVVDFSKSIYDEAQRLITLVNDIIKISRLDDGSVEYDRESIDLYELSEETAKRIKPLSDKAGLKVTVSGEHACVFGVRKILDELIFNLCDNAVKYNRPNGTVEINITKVNGRTELCVKDSGCGIPISAQDRVFERFYRVDSSRSKALGGTGLGLSIVKHGAIYHGAEIKLESEENVGTAITVSFPEQTNANA